MADKPILFSAPMIRALLDGRKTMTRRLLGIRGHKTFTEFGPSTTKGYDWHLRDRDKRWHDLRAEELLGRLQNQPGDRLWVRETWTAQMNGGWTIADARRRMFKEKILYRADGEKSIDGWWPSIHMPREFSRLTLIVESVKVERLQDISGDDCVSEGIPANTGAPMGVYLEKRGENAEAERRWQIGMRRQFCDLWNSLYGPGAWEANPWVSAITFRVVRGNIDQIGEGA